MLCSARNIASNIGSIVGTSAQFSGRYPSKSPGLRPEDCWQYWKQFQEPRRPFSEQFSGRASNFSGPHLPLQATSHGNNRKLQPTFCARSQYSGLVHREGANLYKKYGEHLSLWGTSSLQPAVSHITFSQKQLCTLLTLTVHQHGWIANRYRYSGAHNAKSRTENVKSRAIPNFLIRICMSRSKS